MNSLVTALATEPGGREPPVEPYSHGGHGDDGAEHGPHDEGQSNGDRGGGIEWEDDIVAVSRLTTSANMRWKLVDRTTGALNAAIDWTFTVGDRVNIRLVNEMDSDHPMHHPFHLHGACRFLVLVRDGEPESNLVWEDTVLVRTVRPWTSCSTSATPGCGRRTATSPSTGSFTVARAHGATR